MSAGNLALFAAMERISVIEDAFDESVLCHDEIQAIEQLRTVAQSISDDLGEMYALVRQLYEQSKAN